MSSHIDKKVNNNFLLWLNEKYGKIGKVTSNRDNAHNYLGMTITFKDCEVIIDMKDYVKDMLSKFPIKFKGNEKVMTPAGLDMFSKDLGKKLDRGERETLHKFTAKALFLCKRA